MASNNLLCICQQIRCISEQGDKQVFWYSYRLILANHLRIHFFVEQGSKKRVIAFSLANLP